MGRPMGEIKEGREEKGVQNYITALACLQNRQPMRQVLPGRHPENQSFRAGVRQTRA